MKVSNKELIIKELEKKKENGVKYILGCYDEGIEKLSKKELKEVLESLFFDATDIPVKIRGKQYIIELFTVGMGNDVNEIDLNLMSRQEYINTYDRDWYEEHEE